MTGERLLAAVIPFPGLQKLPEIPVPLWLERAQRVYERNQDQLHIRLIALWIFWLVALVGIAVDVVGRLLFYQIANWPSLVVAWVPPTVLALLVLIIMDRKLAAVTAQFGGFAQFQKCVQLLCTIGRYHELRARYLECASQTHDERCFGLRPVYTSLADFCLPLAEQGQPFDSHLRSAESCLNEAATVLY